MQTSGLISSNYADTSNQLSSWKEIAAYLKCGVRTVQRWERLEGLPVHRHQHQKNGTVYAYRSELDAWRRSRGVLEPIATAPVDEPDEPKTGDQHSRSNGSDTSTGTAGARTVRGNEQPELDGEECHAQTDRVQSTASSAVLPRPSVGVILEPFPAPTPAVTVEPRERFRNAAVFGLLLAGAVAVLATAYLVRRRATATPAPQVTRKMLAVLPFLNLSGDPEQDYFSDGLTEEMITDLGRLDPDRLGVIARTSAMKYKHTGEDVAQIGKELGVGYVLEGSVRRDQNRLRVSAQLIQVSDQTHLWAQNYERDVRNVLGVQQEVATAITSRIFSKLDHVQQAVSPAPQTQDVAAYEDYLRGRFFWNLRSTDGFYKAIDYFNRAVQKDPNYARAYAGLADCYTLLALYGVRPEDVMPRAKAAALKSVRLDASLPEGYTSLAAVEALWDWNWPAAERDFRRALELDPNYSPAHHWYANLYLVPQRRLQDAIAEMKVASDLDPVSLIVITDLGWTYFVAGDHDKAFEQYSRALEMSPDFVPLHFRLSQYYLQKGLYDQAILQADQAGRLDGHPVAAVPSSGPVTEEDYHRYVRQELQNLKSARYDSTISTRDPSLRTDDEVYPVLYAELGEADEAIDSLQKALTEHNPGLIYVAVDPVFAALRSDVRFQEIERQIGLPRL